MLAAVAAIAILTYQRPVRVLNSDPRFHLLAVKIVRTPNDCLFFGNQLEARARLYLRLKTGLRIPLLPVFPPLDGGRILIPGFVKSGPELVQPCALAIRYRWDNPQSRTRPLSVELVDSAAQAFPARPSTVVFFGRNNSHFGMWDLNEDRTRGGAYRVKIKDQETCLAELELRNLPPVPPFHLGPNAY